jgi:hypothetical protein
MERARTAKRFGCGTKRINKAIWKHSQPYNTVGKEIINKRMHEVNVSTWHGKHSLQSHSIEDGGRRWLQEYCHVATVVGSCLSFQHSFVSMRITGAASSLTHHHKSRWRRYAGIALLFHYFITDKERPLSILKHIATNSYRLRLLTISFLKKGHYISFHNTSSTNSVW